MEIPGNLNTTESLNNTRENQPDFDQEKLEALEAEVASMEESLEKQKKNMGELDEVVTTAEKSGFGDLKNLSAAVDILKEEHDIKDSEAV